MPKPPRKPAVTRKTAREAIASAAPKPVDPRQADLLDAPVPGWMRPCLPTLVDKPPEGADWVHEIKWDGYRVSATLDAGKPIVRTRNGHDWTKRFPAIATAVAALKARSAVIDGEAVILDERGASSFAELQADLDKHGSRRAVLVAFDLMFLDGEILWTKPFAERRAALAALIPEGSPIVLSEVYAGAGAELFRVACEHELEGIVSKRLDKPYRAGRSRAWLKTKCVQSEEFVIIGFQPTSGPVRGAFANIKIATFDGARLRYAGAVGTGFSEAVAAALRKRLDAIVTPRCAVAGLKGKGAVWVSPDLKARIVYRGLTTAGELRHASFKGLAEG